MSAIKKSYAADPYKSFAGVYDQDAHAEVTASFFRATCDQVALPKDRPVLDLGCGTGTLTALLAAAGCEVIAVDRSPEMLTLARKRCHRFRRQIRFVEGDLAALPALPPCALAVACGDIVNHLPSRQIVKQVLRNVRGCLQPGGLVLFETLKRFCFESYWDDKSYYMEGKNGDLVMNCTWDRDRGRGTARMIAFTKKRGNIYEKSETSLVEYLYEEKDLLAWLRAAGFAKIDHKPWSPWSDQVQ